MSLSHCKTEEPQDLSLEFYETIRYTIRNISIDVIIFSYGIYIL